jgi:hypothetical protein
VNGGDALTAERFDQLGVCARDVANNLVLHFI